MAPADIVSQAKRLMDGLRHDRPTVVQDALSELLPEANARAADSDQLSMPVDELTAWDKRALAGFAVRLLQNLHGPGGRAGGAEADAGAPLARTGHPDGLDDLSGLMREAEAAAGL